MKLISKVLLIMVSFSILMVCLIYLTFKNIVIPDQLETVKKRARSMTVILKEISNDFSAVDCKLLFNDLQKQDSTLAYILFVDTSGKAIIHSDQNRVGMVFNDNGTLQAAKYGKEVEQIYFRDKDKPESPFHNQRVYDVLIPITTNGKTIGAVNVGLTLQYLDQLENKYTSLILYMIIIIIVALLFSFFSIYRNIISPIKALVDATLKIRSGIYDFKIKKNRKDEIGLLINEFSVTSSAVSTLLGELKKSEDELTKYIDQLPNFNIKLSLDGDILLANSTTLNCLGISIEEIKKKKFWELFPPQEERQELIRTYFYEAVNRGRIEFDENIVPNNCTEKIIDFSISLVKNSDSSSYLIVDGIDTTDKVRINIELKNKSREIQALFDNVPGYLFFKDTNGKYIACNQKFVDLIGKTSEEISGKTDNDLFSPEKAAIYQEQDKIVIESGELLSIDEEEMIDHGKLLKLMKKKVPLKDESGKIIGVIGIAFDISELKNIEKALKDSEARFKSLVENIPFGVVETDYEGNITFINKAITELSEFSREEILVKKNWDFAYKKEDREFIQKRLSEIKDVEATPKPIFFSSKTKSGKIIELQVDSNIRRDNSGALLGIVSVITDVTEKKRIQNELIRSEEKYRNIFDKSSLGLYRTTLEGELLDINLAFALMFGYDSIEDMKKSVKRVPDLYVNVSERQNLIEKLRTETSMLKFEIHFRKKDGSIMVGNLSIRSLPDEHGVNRILEGFIEDITERFLYEKKIKEQLVFLQTLIDTIPNPIFYRNAKMVYEGCNVAYEKLLGKSRDTIIGKTIYDIFPENTAVEFIQKDKELLKTLKSEQSEIEITHSDGSIHYYISQRAVYHNIEGALAGIIGVLFDVTDRKYNERDLRQKLDLLDIAPVSFFVIDMNSKMQYWNKGSEQLYGISSQEIVGRDLGDLMVKGILSMQEYSYLLNIKDTAFDKEYWEGEIRQINNEGKELIIESKAKLARNIKGEAEYVLIVNLDVTERKKLENQLLLSQRLESLGTLASGIAHDLNNMLSPIVLGLDIIKNKLKDTESIDWIKTLQDTAKRGSDLVRQILSFARGLSDKFTYVQPRYVISEFIKIIKGTFPKSIQISKDVPNELWAIMGDSTQIHQLLMNLCVNARDAMPEGGNLKITAENVMVDDNLVKTNVNAKTGSYILISISDTGSGIDPKIMSKVFDPFFTTKEVGKGTGLGLSTVFNIVKNHKGFMNVYSELGKGTSFKVYFPAVSTEEKEQDIVVQHIPFGKQELILVVDDETAVREIIRATLEAYGYEVISASNGAEAVAIFAKNLLNVKAAIVDMIMPIMDGSATIQALKTINPEIKIIAASGFEDAKDKPIMEKVEGFLAKPFTAEAILRLLAETLNS